MDKRINTRVLHKHDIESNWQKAQNFIPLKSEIIIYDEDENYSYKRIKIGDGETGVNALPFYSGDWNNLQNRPFYEEGSSTTITWDGNTEGRDYLFSGTEGGCYHVSDLTPSVDELIGSTVTINQSGTINESEILPEYIEQINNDVVKIASGMIYVAYKANAVDTENDDTFPKAGVYFTIMNYTGSQYISSLTYGGYIKQLDEKFIPDTIARVDEIEDYINNAELITVEDIDAICGQTIQVETLPNAEEASF